MANPFEGMDDDQKEYQKVVSENVNKRMENAMGDLKKKYANGQKEDNSEGGPTGDAYKKHQDGMKKKASDMKKAMDKGREQEAIFIKQERENLKDANDDNDNDSSDDEYDDLLNDVDNDPEMEALRSARMMAMRHQAGERAENIAKGHGTYRHISQDEFLAEVTASKWCAFHFYHKEFERCKILHHHLDLIAPHHVECKFGQIDAEKCPFFIQKLQIQMLPCLIVFKDGVVVDRLTGFDALAIDPAEPDKWHTSRLQAWIASCGAIKFTMPNEEVRKEMKKMGIVQRGTIWSENRAHESESDNED